MKKLINILTLCVFILLISCQENDDNNLTFPTINSAKTELSDNEIKIISQSAIDIEIAKILKNHTNNKIEVLKTGNELGELTSCDSLSLYSRINSKNRIEILNRIIEKANNVNYSFCCYIDDNNKTYIAVLKDKSDLKFIEKRGTHAINYDMISKDLIAKLTEWRKKYNFRIIQVSRDYIDIKFDTAPKQTKEFQQMVAQFCPDVVDWLNEKEYIFIMDNENGYLNLWWD